MIRTAVNGRFNFIRFGIDHGKTANIPQLTIYALYFRVDCLRSMKEDGARDRCATEITFSTKEHHSVLPYCNGCEIGVCINRDSIRRHCIKIDRRVRINLTL